MKKNEIEQIISEHPETVFTRDGRRDGVLVIGFVKEKSWGASRPTTKAVTRYVRNDGQVAEHTGVTTLASITGVRASNIATYAAVCAQQQARYDAEREAQRQRQAAKEAARKRAKAAIKDRHDEIIAGLANVLGCKADDIKVNGYTGEVTITLWGDVAVNIVEERAYCYA